MNITILYPENISCGNSLDYIGKIGIRVDVKKEGRRYWKTLIFDERTPLCDVALTLIDTVDKFKG